jgi:translation initiation factor IF-2
MRGEEEIWRGPVEGLKRHKDDAKEVAKGLECGILLKGFNAIEVGDRLEAFEVTYIEQEL